MLMASLFNADEFVVSSQVYYLHTWFYLIISERLNFSPSLGVSLSFFY